MNAPKKVLITIGGPPNTGKGILAQEISKLLLTNHGIKTLPVTDPEDQPPLNQHNYQDALKSLIAANEAGELEIEILQLHVFPNGKQIKADTK